MTAFNSVLLIEDNPGDARLVTHYLDERFGADCSVQCAPTLALGIRALQGAGVDVILLDLGLPDRCGLGTYTEINRHAPRTPVVILTGDHDEDPAVEALRQGAEDYLARQDADSVTLLRAMRHAVQRRHMSEQLRDSEARFRALVETAEEGILQLDRAGTVLYLNARAARLLGTAPIDTDAAPARPAVNLTQWLRDGDRAAVQALLRAPVGERTSCELEITRAGAEPCWVIAAAGGITSRAARPSETVLLLTDITGRKLAEGELQRLRRDLEALVTERTAQLLATNFDLQTVNRSIAHDLLNPL